MTNDRDPVMVYLTQHDTGQTVRHIAEALDMGYSTVAKRLQKLEAAGEVRRESPDRSITPRPPDQWFPVTPTPGLAPAPDAAADAEVDVDDSTAAESPSEPSGTNAVRLKHGELRDMVAYHLAEHADEAFTPYGIGKALGRSTGAVHNALNTLVASGHAKLIATKPFRYQAG